MICNFWFHKTKQVNQTIETYNNGNKRGMIRQRRKDRQRVNNFGVSLNLTNKRSKFTLSWHNKEVFLHQCNGSATIVGNGSIFWSTSTLWVQNVENKSREVVKSFAHFQGQEESSFWGLKVYKPFFSVNYKISFVAYCKLVVG